MQPGKHYYHTIPIHSALEWTSSAQLLAKSTEDIDDTSDNTAAHQTHFEASAKTGEE